MTAFFAGDDHPDHLEDFSDADAWFDAESREFWRKIHRMSSATYVPTRATPSIWAHQRMSADIRRRNKSGGAPLSGSSVWRRAKEQQAE